MCVLQDVLTDLSAECENLPIEGVSGACYAHKVNAHLNTTPLLCRPSQLCYVEEELCVSVEINAVLCPWLMQGMYQAAGYIYKKLVNDGILNQAFSIAPVRRGTEVGRHISIR